jgi:hypothetical protein
VTLSLPLKRSDQFSIHATQRTFAHNFLQFEVNHNLLSPCSSFRRPTCQTPAVCRHSKGCVTRHLDPEMNFSFTSRATNPHPSLINNMQHSALVEPRLALRQQDNSFDCLFSAYNILIKVSINNQLTRVAVSFAS